ncbi:Major facilitator superfamily domain containing protein [Rhypophila decipiens]
MAAPHDEDVTYKEKPVNQQYQQGQPISSRPDHRVDDIEEKQPITEMIGVVNGAAGREPGWQALNGGDNASSTGKKNRSDKMGNENDDTPSFEIELQEPGTNTTASRNRGNGEKRSRILSALGFGDKGSTNTTAPPGEEWSGEYRVYKRRWFGLLQLTLMNIIVSWDWLTFSPVSEHAAKYFFGSTDANNENIINWLSTAFLFSFVVITPVVIYVLHLGPKPSIVTSAALLLVGNWVRYAGTSNRDVGNFPVVMFGQILTGLAQPFVLAAPTRYSDIWFTTEGRVAATALTTLANPFGAALGQLIVPLWVQAPTDISRMVLYVSIISTISCLPSFFIPAAPPTPVSRSNETPKLDLRESAPILFKNLEFWIIFSSFSVYVGCFNSISSILVQVLSPWGFSDEEAGIGGGVLIVVGLVTSAILSPLIGKKRAYLTTIRIAVPLIGLCYLIFIWMPKTYKDGGLAGPYVALCLLGASSFSLMPVVLEFLVELTHPISPAVTSTIALSGGQLLGGIFIIVSGALKAGPDGDPPFNMYKALIFHAVVAMVFVIPPLTLGLFGRAEKIKLKRVNSDDRSVGRRSDEIAPAAV